MPAAKIYQAAIIGASGYTGVDLIRLLKNHPKVNIAYLVADKNAGKSIADIYPHLSMYDLPSLISLDEVVWKHVDIVFCCLPHATTQKVVKSLPSNMRVIDLSADFRLFDVDVYKKWYGQAHQAPAIQKKAVYGLSELYREPIKGAKLVACPGCYPTAASLPLVPLLRRHVLDPSSIIIDAKSGITGAGRAAKQDNLFAEINEGVKAYNVCKHRHMPEIEQTLSAAAAEEVKVHFTPQIVPMNRGILSTIYVKVNKDNRVKDIKECLHQRYDQEHFVHILGDDQLPSTQHVKGTNHCLISVVKGRVSGSAVIVSVIDNLVKGASGQAVQNMNIMLGLKEELGLDFVAQFP